MIEDALSAADSKMHKAIEALKRDLVTIRTGRASPSLVDRLTVDYYGVPTPLNQMATVTAPEARLLVIQPWDRRMLPTIEKAILKSDLGLNPASDGSLIRLSIPQLTEERRRELVKVVRKKVEEGKVAVRNIRRDAADELKELEKEKVISEDEHHRASERLQKQTDRFIAEVDKVGEQKTAELMEV
ncbi:MAG: ribosome recycling factor [Chloroflexota bacterium]|nr:MAG: ribosome recycling factor [Chloroflexota bacterium]